MISGSLAWVLGLVLDPRFGIPFLVLLEATLLWVAWNPRANPPLGARRRSWRQPQGDAISRIYYALRDEQFSTLVRWSRQRIEELYEARAHAPLPALPWTFRRGRGGPEDPYALRRLTLDLGSFEWEAREREIGVHVRWAFWRTRARDRALYRARVGALLDRAETAIRGLEAPVP